MKLFVLFIVFFIFNANSFSSDLKTESSPSSEGIFFKFGDKNILDDTHHFISHNFWYLTSKIDGAIAGENEINDEDNKSQVRFNFITIKTEGKPLVYESTFKFKISLPSIEKRLQLIVEKTVEEAEEVIVGTNTSKGQVQSKTIQEVVKESRFSAAARYLFLDTAKWQIYSDLGMKISLPVNPFARFKIKRNFQLEKWKISLSEKVYWHLKSGLGENTTINVDRKINKDMTFRFGNSGVWSASDEVLSYSHGFYLHHRPHVKHSFLYKISTSGSTENSVHLSSYMAGINYSHFPFKKHTFTYTLNANGVMRYTPHIVSYYLGLSHRYLLYKNWMFFTTSPAVLFEKDNNFKPTPSISFRLEVIFSRH